MTFKCEAPPPFFSTPVRGNHNPRAPQPKDNLFATKGAPAGHMIVLLFPSALASFEALLTQIDPAAVTARRVRRVAQRPPGARPRRRRAANRPLRMEE